MTDNLSTAERLQNALSQLIDEHASDKNPSTFTATALCRRAGISRNTLYRYHRNVLYQLHKLQHKHARDATPTQQAFAALRDENTAQRTQLCQLAALVDHYFAAWSESQTLLKRREAELVSLRKQSKPILKAYRETND